MLNDFLMFMCLIFIYLFIGYIFKHLTILYYVVKAVKYTSPSDKQAVKDCYKGYWNKAVDVDLMKLINKLDDNLARGEKTWFDDFFLTFLSLLFWPILLLISLPIVIFNYISSKLPNTNLFIKLMECQTEEKCEIKENIKNNLKTFNKA